MSVSCFSQILGMGLPGALAISSAFTGQSSCASMFIPVKVVLLWYSETADAWESDNQEGLLCNSVSAINFSQFY